MAQAQTTIVARHSKHAALVKWSAAFARRQLLQHAATVHRRHALQTAFAIWRDVAAQRASASRLRRAHLLRRAWRQWYEPDQETL